MAGRSICYGERKHMKKLTFVLVGSAALLAAACSRGNEDQVNNADMNQYGAEDLNNLAAEAANNAEAEALGNQLNELNQEDSADNTDNPTDADEQNVSGM
jgi:hypothetical protein